MLSTWHPRKPIPVTNKTGNRRIVPSAKTLYETPIIRAPHRAAISPVIEIPPFMPGVTFLNVVIMNTFLSMTPSSEANVSELITENEIANSSK